MCFGPELMFIAQGVKMVGDLTSASDAAKQRERRAGEIYANAKEQEQQTSKFQERRRGGMKAAYGKSGVKLAGTATRLIETQIKEDERELLNIRYNADIQARDELQKAKQIRREAAVNFFSGSLKAGKDYQDETLRQEAASKGLAN